MAKPQPHNDVRLSPARSAIANLSPGYFALVMGTGIISIGLEKQGLDLLSKVLLAIAALCYVSLWVLFIWRVVSYHAHMIADMRDPEKVFAYFSVVAATVTTNATMNVSDRDGRPMCTPGSAPSMRYPMYSDT